MSRLSRYGDRRAIRGGVPICWPWFGVDPSGKGRPAHGFARNRDWDLIDVQQTENDGIKLTLSLAPDPRDEPLWHCAYSLKMVIEIGEQLTLSLTTENLDKESFVISQALHTYFAVGNIEKTQVRGLSNHHSYQYFVCVETANAANNSISLAPGETHTISAGYRIMPLG